jgi:putative phosphoribosyl transferase
MVLASEIARVLGADLDVIIARKVGAPRHPEYGIGAVAPGGVSVHDPRALHQLGLSEEDFQKLAEDEWAEVNRRLNTYRGERPPLELDGRTAILVDDGLATGVTAVAASRYARSLNPQRLVFAVPICTSQGREAVAKEVDEVVCLSQPEPFYAVGQWYQDFAQVEDEEVLELMRPGDLA